MRYAQRMFIFLLFLASANSNPVQKPLWVKKFGCVDKPYHQTKLLSCGILNLRNNEQQVIFALDLLRPIVNVIMSFSLYAQYKFSRVFLYGTSFDYCGFMEDYKEGRNPTADIAYNFGKANFPSLMTKCPITGLLNVTGIPVGRKMIPPYIPPGSYYSYVRVYNKRNQTLLAWSAEFDMTESHLLANAAQVFG